MAQSVKFQLRRDTATNWAGNNPILALGEPGYAVVDGTTSGNRMKIGNGQTGWNYLPYVDCGTTGATGVTGATGLQGATGNASQGSWSALISDPTQIIQSTSIPGTFTKIAASGWSGYVSSAQSYTSGCYASFTLGSGSSFIGLGVSGTSPATIPTGIENSIYVFQGTTPGLFLYANGVQITGPGLTGGAGSWGSSAVGDNFNIQYDGANITFYQNGVQIGPSVARTLRTPLYLYAIQNEQNSFMQNLVFGSGGGSGGGAGVTGYGQNSWTPVLYNMAQSGATAGTFTNTYGGGAAWGTSQVSSLQGFRQAYASFTLPFPSTANSYLGISTAPTPVSGAIPESGPPTNFWGIYSYGTGVGSPTIYVLENNVPTNVTSIGTVPVLATDVFTVSYDGVNFNYYQNSTLLKTTAYTLPAGSLFYLMGQHSVPATSFANVVFSAIGNSANYIGVIATFQGGTGGIGSTAVTPNSTTYILGETGQTGRALSFDSTPIFATSLNVNSPITPTNDPSNYPGFNIAIPGTYKAVFTNNSITGATPPGTGQFWNIPFGINVDSVDVAGDSNSQCLVYGVSNSISNGLPSPVNTFYFTTTTENTIVYLANNFSYFVVSGDPGYVYSAGFDIILLGRYTIEFTRLS